MPRLQARTLLTKRQSRRARRALAVGLGAVTALIAFAAPAAAHAVLLETNPGPGQVLDQVPRDISLRFNENVEASLGAVRLFDHRGTRVVTGTASKSSSDTVQVAVPSRLSNGSYVVTWRVISADAHPVEGAFTFQVGSGSNATNRAVLALRDRLLHQQTNDRAVAILAGIARGALFAGLALLIGAVAFVSVVSPQTRSHRRARRLVWAGWWTVTAATVLGLLVQGPYGAGLGVADVFKPSVIGDVLDTRYGHFAVVRLVLLGAAIPLLRVLLVQPARALPRWWNAAAAAVAAALALTPGLAGHAATGDLPGLSVPLDALHVLAMAIWIGGLVVLAFAVLPLDRLEDAIVTVGRFSGAAMFCVVTLIVSGGFQTWRQVGGFSAFASTDYGKILLVKLALFAVLILTATRSRAIARFLAPAPVEMVEEKVPVVTGGSDDVDTYDEVDDWIIDEQYEFGRLRRFVLAEVVLALAIILATALLVNAVPAKVADGQGNVGASNVTLESTSVWVDITVVPGQPGRNDLHITAIKPDGAPITLKELTVTLELPSKNIAKIDVPLRELGPGHYLSPGLDIPIVGKWRITAKATLTEFDEETLVGNVTIG